MQTNILSVSSKVKNLSAQVTTLQNTINKCEEQLKSEYLNLCCSNNLTPMTLSSVDEYISEIFRIFPSKYQEDINTLNELLSEMTNELENHLETEKSVNTERLKQSEQEEYLYSEIAYHKEINKELQEEINYVKNILGKMLKEETKSLPQAAKKAYDCFESMFKENKKLINILDENTIENQEIISEKDKLFMNKKCLEDEIISLKREIEDQRNHEVEIVEKIHDNFLEETESMKALIIEYKKNKQELENKINSLYKSLSEAYKIRDILANELSEKCDMIENLTKRSY